MPIEINDKAELIESSEPADVSMEKTNNKLNATFAPNHYKKNKIKN